jgi:HEPN domain-containing protein
MKRSESTYPGDWLRIAERDVERVQKLLDLHDPEAAGFFLQQATEKFLKAFLLSKGWTLRRIHDLEVLLNEAVVFDAAMEKHREVLQKISGLYFLERYPLVMESGLSETEMKELLHSVRSLFETIRTSL